MAEKETVMDKTPIDELLDSDTFYIIRNLSDMRGTGKNLKDACLNACYPIGSTYIQLPGEKTPAELGWPGIWENVSSEIAGDFIRFEGGNASEFNSGQQQGLIEEHNHGLSDANISTYGGPYDWSFAVLAAADSYRGANDHPVTNDSGGIETRPINQTVRKWRRSE